jgi:hypothetical protein
MVQNNESSIITVLDIDKNFEKKNQTIVNSIISSDREKDL